MWVQFLGQEDAMEEGMTTHSSILAWRISWIAEPGGLQSMTLQRVGRNYVMEHTHTANYHKSVYPWRVLEVRSPKSGFEKGCVSSRGSRD